jgi:hypothetical protein
MLHVQYFQPRIRFRLDDAVTALRMIERVDNQQLGKSFQRDMENISNSKMQNIEAVFTAQMQTLLATQQKITQNFTPAPSADGKGTAESAECKSLSRITSSCQLLLSYSYYLRLKF